jgi:hypothetical protein
MVQENECEFLNKREDQLPSIFDFKNIWPVRDTRDLDRGGFYRLDAGGEKPGLSAFIGLPDGIHICRNTL